MIYRFADCVLDTQLYTLYRADQSTRLAPKVFEVLCYLIEHRNQRGLQAGIMRPDLGRGRY